jgi:Replication-relaxation
MRRTSTGRRVELSARDIELFKLLIRYRYLRSTYLYAFVGGASETRFKERLGDLFHEGYLDRPVQQWEFSAGRCRPAVHEIGKRGQDALRECGGGFGDEVSVKRTAPRQFLHALMICEALASIEIAACSTEGLRFIGWPEIVAKAPENLRASALAQRLPLSSGGFVVPDAVFGIEYRTNSAKSYRFFALEADRGTMPISRSKSGQTSYLGKLAAYAEVLAGQAHKTHWGVPNLLVLTLTTNPTRCSEIVAKLGTGSPAFLFRAVEGRALTAPLPELLREPWDRAGHAPLSIAESS